MKSQLDKVAKNDFERGHFLLELAIKTGMELI